MSAELILSKFDFTKYLWTSAPTQDGSECRVRPLAGAEYVQEVYNVFLKGEQTLFFVAYVDLATALSEQDLITACRDTWSWTRYQIPAVATSIFVDDNGISMLKYQSTTSEGAKDWATRTLIIHSQDKIDLDELRGEVGVQKVPSEAGDQTWLHLVMTPSQGGRVTQFGLLFHSHHGPFDGTGAKILMNLYLRQLAKAISGTGITISSLPWGGEAQNLLPAAFNVLAPSEPLPIPPDSSEEPTFASPYYAAVGGVLKDINDTLQNAHGFAPRAGDEGWPRTIRQPLVFSAEESSVILKALKPTSSAVAYTLTHLAHAALSMVTAFDNPAHADAREHYINNFSLTNGRDFLKEPYSSREGYPGYCLGVNVMRVPVSAFLAEDGAPLPLNKDTLVGVMRVVRQLYNDQKNAPCHISYMGQASEIFSAGLKYAVMNNLASPNQSYSFSSDGVGERHLDAVFNDASGKPILSLAQFFTSVNCIHPGSFYRLSSWKGIIDLGVDYNSNIISKEEAQIRLAKWKEYMFLITRFTKDDY